MVIAVKGLLFKFFEHHQGIDESCCHSGIFEIKPAYHILVVIGDESVFVIRGNSRNDTQRNVDLLFRIFIVKSVATVLSGQIRPA